MKICFPRCVLWATSFANPHLFSGVLGRGVVGLDIDRCIILVILMLLVNWHIMCICKIFMVLKISAKYNKNRYPVCVDGSICMLCGVDIHLLFNVRKSKQWILPSLLNLAGDPGDWVFNYIYIYFYPTETILQRILLGYI